MTASEWWMYHGDPQHTGLVAGSGINAKNVKTLETVASIEVPGPVMSVPAIAGGYTYVGLANSRAVPAGNGGSILKIELATGKIVSQWDWPTPLIERDTHSFAGMGCTPAVFGGKVYFSAFDGKLYCRDANDLTKEIFTTDLRHQDIAHNQPLEFAALGAPQAEGWSSPVVVDLGGGDVRVYVGIGEGENPNLYSFVHCLDGNSGNVKWSFCTCQYESGSDNAPNLLPQSCLPGPVPPMFTIINDTAGGIPVTLGSCVWSSIAYDPELRRIYCATGNPVPDGALPTPGYSNSIVVLDAATGAFVGAVQIPANTSYRQSDEDVDIGGSPTIFMREGKKVVGVGCKNGCYMIIDADTLDILATRQMLPYYNNGTQIETVDIHPPASQAGQMDIQTSNDVSNLTLGENFQGTYSTAAVDAANGRLFIGIGGNNYHSEQPGIRSDVCPFLRALDPVTLADIWPFDDNDPKRYKNAIPPMYTTPSESGLSSPAIVNDVVFCSTTGVSVYAFDAADGTCLWSDKLGDPTFGYNGGYGYCIGAAVSGNYVVAGGLILGMMGGVLRIYKLP